MNSAENPPSKAIGFLPQLSLTGSNILVFIGLFSISPNLPAINKHFIDEPGADILTQMVGATSGFTFAIGCLLVGRIINYFGDRRVYLVSALLFGVVGASAALMDNLYWIIASRALVGLASAGIVNGALVAIGRILPPSEQTRVLGLQALIASVIAIFAFPAIGQLSSIDWRLPFLVHLFAIVFMPSILALPAARTARDNAEISEVAPKAQGVGALILLTTVFVGMVLFISSFFGPLFLATIGIYILIMKKVSISGAFVLALGAMAVGLAIAGLSPSFWAVVGGTLVTGIGCGVFSPNINAAAIHASPRNPGPTLGFVNALLYGAMILFPVIATPLATLLDGPRVVIIAYGVLAATFAGLFCLRANVASGRSRVEAV
jgi:MFS family permease